RLIVQSVAGDLFVRIRPFGIDRIGEGGAGTRNVGCLGGNKRGGRNDARGCQCGPVFQGFSPFLGSKASAGRNATHGPGLSAAIARAATVDLKNALHGSSGNCCCAFSAWISEVLVSHRRRMSPFYKCLVTLK